jgi:[ribosomal protein S5]-alanine N-acetyltransferase
MYLQTKLMLSTPRLQLRPIQASDAEILLKAKQESWAELYKWNVGVVAEYEKLNLTFEQEFCAKRAEAFGKHERFNFLAFTQTEEAFVGVGSLNWCDWANGLHMLGYWVHSAHTGKGYATEIAQALVHHAFIDLKAFRLTSFHAAPNVASGRVLEKVGFKREGVWRQHHVVRGARMDEVHYGLLASEASLS